MPRKTTNETATATATATSKKTKQQQKQSHIDAQPVTHNHCADECSRHVIDVVIPRDRLNDFRYIQLQLLDAKCNALDYLAKKLNVTLDSLVDKYIPELNPTFHSAIYNKYSITIEQSYDNNTDELDDE